MTCVILQPSYIPWRGYFHQIHKADIFVFYDDVQYDRHGWRNRNRIKTAQGEKWLTIPLQGVGSDWQNARICDMHIAPGGKWRNSHFETLRHAYKRAPFFNDYKPMLERWYATDPHSLAGFTIPTTIELARALGIETTKFVRSSELGCSGHKTERLLAILKTLGATRYVSGPAARDYLDVPLLNAAGIDVEWMEYDYPQYPQLYPPFDPYVSILDLLFMTGPGASEYIWGTWDPRDAASKAPGGH